MKDNKVVALLDTPSWGRWAILPAKGEVNDVRGFTLIELLVVVLIIGILAAVAVPQYQVAVVKSRVGALLPLMASLSQAQEVYYLAHGEYTNDVSALSVDIPLGECTETVDNSGKEIPDSVYMCGDFTLAVVSNGLVNLNYCPDDSENYADCKSNRTVHITFRPQHYKNASQNGQRRCSVYNDSTLAKAVCASLGLIDANQ